MLRFLRNNDSLLIILAPGFLALLMATQWFLQPWYPGFLPEGSAISVWFDPAGSAVGPHFVKTEAVRSPWWIINLILTYGLVFACLLLLNRTAQQWNLLGGRLANLPLVIGAMMYLFAPDSQRDALFWLAMAGVIQSMRQLMLIAADSVSGAPVFNAALLIGICTLIDPTFATLFIVAAGAVTIGRQWSPRAAALLITGAILPWYFAWSAAYLTNRSLQFPQVDFGPWSWPAPLDAVLWLFLLLSIITLRLGSGTPGNLREQRKWRLMQWLGLCALFAGLLGTAEWAFTLAFIALTWILSRLLLIPMHPWIQRVLFYAFVVICAGSIAFW